MRIFCLSKQEEKKEKKKEIHPIQIGYRENKPPQAI